MYRKNELKVRQLISYIGLKSYPSAQEIGQYWVITYVLTQLHPLLINKTNRMSSLTKFFHICAGVDQSILRRTPTDTNKYASIGATIFFTGIFASLAGGYALYTVFDSSVVAIIFGLLWGLMIFNLDRYIVMSIKKTGKVWQEIMMALPRIFLAVLIAFVIAKPLELKLFESEIDAELVLKEQELYKEQEALLKSRYQGDIDLVNDEIKDLKYEIKSKAAKKDELALAAVQEADGTGGSGQRNLGPIYKAKKTEADKAEAELQELQSVLEPQIADRQEKLKMIETEMATSLENLDKTELSGLAARLDALGNLSQKSSTILWASIFITLLFIAIETAPLFVKLISTRSPYDYRLNQHEVLAQNIHDLYAGKLQSQTTSDLRFTSESNRAEVIEKITAEKEVLKHIIKSEVEQMKETAISWKDYKQLGRKFS